MENEGDEEEKKMEWSKQERRERWKRILAQEWERKDKHEIDSDILPIRNLNKQNWYHVHILTLN